MRSWGLLVLLLAVGAAAQDPSASTSFTCPSEPLADGRYVCIATVDVNVGLPSSFMSALADHERTSNLANLVPSNLDRGLFSLLGLGACCKDFAVVGEVCIPGCKAVERYTVGDLLAALDPTDDLAGFVHSFLVNAFENLDLLPPLHIEIYFRPCDGEFGLSVMVDETVLKTVEIFNVGSSRVQTKFVTYDPATRTATVDLPLPLSVGLLEVTAELQDIVLGDRGVSFTPRLLLGTGDFAVGIDREVEVVAFDDVVIGELDGCSHADSCGDCSEIPGCGWCEGRGTCHPLDDTSCPCEDACGVWEGTCPPSREEVCWFTPTEGHPVSADNYQKMLVQLGIFSEEEASQMVATMDTDQDGMISPEEARRENGNSLSDGAVVAITLGVLVAVAIAVLVGAVVVSKRRAGTLSFGGKI